MKRGARIDDGKEWNVTNDGLAAVRRPPNRWRSAGRSRGARSPPPPPMRQMLVQTASASGLTVQRTMPWMVCLFLRSILGTPMWSRYRTAIRLLLFQHYRAVALKEGKTKSAATPAGADRGGLPPNGALSPSSPSR